TATLTIFATSPLMAASTSSQTLPMSASTPPAKCVEALSLSPWYIAALPEPSVTSQYAEHLLGHAGCRLCRVLTDACFLLGDYCEQAVQRLLGDVAFDGAVFRIDRAEPRSLGRDGVVLLGDADLIGGLLDDRHKALADLITAGLIQVLGCRIIATGEDAFGIGYGHLLHRVQQQLLGLRHGGFGGLIHAVFQGLD